MMQCHDRLQSVFSAAADYIQIVESFRLVKPAFLGFNPRPLGRKAIGVQPGFCHQTDVLTVTVIVVDRVQGRFVVGCVFHVFHCPAVAAGVVSFDLMRRCSGADQEIR